MDKSRTIIIIIMDVLLLAEMIFAIWLSHDDTVSMAWTFSMAFVPPALATVVGARLAVKRWSPPLSGELYRPVGIMGPRG
ncbi:MAG: hypothetical protein HY794_19110 [Desulfarculus sp.]|nr:hypothetical protein [Desulfarculus sp.]